MEQIREYEVHDWRFKRLASMNARLVRLWSGAAWAEGPVWFADANQLLFSDIPNDRILRFVPDVTGLDILKYIQEQGVNIATIVLTGVEDIELAVSAMKLGAVEYLIKPMNCPGHVLVYRSAIRSYRELPLRYFEFGTVYRYERSGVLHGLFRVRGFTQDDAHIFCTPEQLGAELIKLIDDVVAVLRRFGFDAFDVTLSTRPEDAIGEPRVWELAEGALRAALEARSLAYTVDEGGGAFYGPKIDIKIKDALGRSWQCSTIQVDFNLPQRFDVRYRTAEGKDEHAIMIHRALLGSLERFFGVLIEHYAGAFPPWLAPVQTAVLPVSDRTLAYAESVRDRLVAAGVRASVDSSAERLPHKIREAVVQKVPFILVVGEREAAADTVALRSWNNPASETIGVDDVIRRLREEPH